MAIQAVKMTAPAAYPGVGAPNVVLNFQPRKVTFRMNSISETAEVSYDGSTDHIYLVGLDICKSYEASQTPQKIWIKGSNNVEVIVIAED